MRLFLITFFVFSIFAGTAQQQACWECLISARNLDAKIALERCIQTAKNPKLNPNEKEVISFVIGRLFLGEGKYENALKYLSLPAKSSDSLLNALSNGLLGDCYLEQNQYELAVTHYSKAAELADNSLFTPYFLNKQGVVFKIQKKEADLERIGSRLRINHAIYFSQMDLKLFYGSEPSVYDSLSRKLLSNQLPPAPYGIGLVNGKTVKAEVFSTQIGKAAQELNAYQPSDQHILNNAWQKTINFMTLQARENAFALHVEEEEFHAYLFGEKGYVLLPNIKASFSNEKGKFIPKNLEDRILTMENEPDESVIWSEDKKDLKQEIANDKYAHLLSSALYVTNAEVKLYDEMTQRSVEVKGIQFPQNYFSEDLFSTSETELQEYFQSHKADAHLHYRAVREMKYFALQIVQSQKDRIEFLNEMNQLKIAFEKTKNDSLFVMEHSDIKVFAPNFMTAFPVSYERSVKPFTYPDALESEIVAANVGDVVGPFVQDEKYRLVKVLGFNENLMTVRHILIASHPDEKTHEANRKRAYELAKKVTHDNFEQNVRRYSADPGSIENGGVYTDFLDYEMVIAFSDYAVNAPIGKIGLVESEFGFHIIEVLERKKVKFPKLAIVEKNPLSNEKLLQEASLGASKLYASMNKELERLPLNKKEHFFDSLANMNNGSQTKYIEEYHPSVSYFALQETNDQMLRIAYDKNVQPYKLYPPINDSTYWIFPFFLNAFSGKDYDYEKVKSIIKQGYLNHQKSDSIRSLCSTFKSLEDLSKETNLPLLGNEIFETTNDFQQFLLSATKLESGIQVFSKNGDLIVYEIISQKDFNPSDDYSEYKKNLQKQRLGKHEYLIQTNTSLKLKTIYNYPVYKLLIRD